MLTAAVQAQPRDLEFKLIEQVLGTRISSVGMTCSKCGRVWGIKFQDEKSFAEINKSKFICAVCSNKKK